MEAKLVELGYRQIMAECAELHEAIVDANPAFAGLGDVDRAVHGRAAWNQCFGALQKVRVHSTQFPARRSRSLDSTPTVSA